jgi:hypothetical protein
MAAEKKQLERDSAPAGESTPGSWRSRTLRHPLCEGLLATGCSAIDGSAQSRGVAAVEIVLALHF